MAITTRDSIEATSLPLLPFGGEIDSIAKRAGLPPALLAAIVQEESRFDAFATREEPAYMRNRAVTRAAERWCDAHPGNPSRYTELADRSRSFGLTQIMGETAREQGYSAKYLATLYIPRNSLAEGARLFKRLLLRYHNDTLSAISAYNQGDARKRRGIFVNARYVYRVTLAWRAYDAWFANR